MFAIGPSFFKHITSSSGYTYSSNQSSLLGRASLTAIVNNTYADDSNLKLQALPFTFKFFGRDFGNDLNGGIYIGSNSFITFGFGSNSYSGFSATNPGLGILVNAADRAWEYVYAGIENGNFRVRWEGSNVGSQITSAYWEMIFFTNGMIQLVLGTYPAPIGVSGISNGTAFSPSTTFDQNTSYALVPDANGSNWVITPGSIVPA